MAMNRSPGVTARESIDTRPIAAAASPCLMEPPAAVATSAALKGNHSTSLRHPAAGATPLQRRPRYLDVVERQHPIANHLILFVSLAGNQHEVARLRLPHGALDRVLAVHQCDAAHLPLSRLRPRRSDTLGGHNATLDLFDD